jgi:hypothetical protein
MLLFGLNTSNLKIVNQWSVHRTHSTKPADNDNNHDTMKGAEAMVPEILDHSHLHIRGETA